MRIFLNSSSILKDFRKIQYAMPCNAMQCILGKNVFLYARLIRYASYMHFYVGKILFFQKAGVTNLSYPGPKKLNRSFHTCSQEVITDIQ
jgi:hypothetical protein